MLAIALILVPLTAHATNWQTVKLFDHKEVLCLAKNIYHESRGESRPGQEAVALVTLNRVASKRYPDSICQVVYQPHQFSWTRQRLRVTDPEAWQQALDTAYRVLNGNITLVNFKATHFHTRQVAPAWRMRLTKVAKIGNHIFYA